GIVIINVGGFFKGFDGLAVVAKTQVSHGQGVIIAGLGINSQDFPVAVNGLTVLAAFGKVLSPQHVFGGIAGVQQAYGNLVLLHGLLQLTAHFIGIAHTHIGGVIVRVDGFGRKKFFHGFADEILSQQLIAFFDVTGIKTRQGYGGIAGFWCGFAAKLGNL